MPTGDVAEVGAAALRSEAVEQKRNSIAHAADAERRVSVAVSGGHDGLVHYDDLPTPEEMRTLRRVPEKIPIKLFSIAFIELCERFSYYGTTIVFTNFIQHDLPEGSLTGADSVQPGVLGMGQRASTGITTFNQFWQYFMPLFGAYIADQYWGRYKTICWALGVDIIGHIILITSAIPGVIPNQSASLACMILGIIVIGFGTGGFKPNVNPMIVEQLGEQHMHVKTLKSGERVIVDPAVTNERIYLWFYFSINVGALAGQVSMVWVEKYVGFWLSYLLPTVMLCLCPAIMIWGRKRYSRRPPSGSVLVPAWRTFILANKGRWSINPWRTYKNLHDGTFWENVKPSKFTDATRPKWMNFDDNWVEEVRRGANACAVFCWYPLFWLCYNQTNNNLVSQAATMKRHGVPNDVITNLNPFSLLIFIPLNDFVIYPFLRKMGIRFTPIKKIACGFFAGCSAMIWSAVVQHYIYSRSECGKYANGEDCPPAEINVWAQSGSYILIALSEVFASITSLEYAYTKAPKNMRSMVQAFALFMNAFAAALGQALVGLSDDPLLVWNYTTAGILAFIGGTCFYLQFRHLDIMEDHLNELPEGLIANKVTGVELPGPKRISNAGAEDTVDDEKRI
ncbi:POT family-domain-containing protein [Emericellopsis atlantica]|uniref:POT family-domain-containing protein n=1 Tax=Emericellopsis atlantica TaxID=2614577 RepID=A0A9P8CQK0_9HYPO|nr:POT family-domain-containing protein [Emericellopsis atlantica]KAG9255387.1 POT family-domain-containing protein [Emericellopsis atlantica]